jgi:hypothetical protein
LSRSKHMFSISTVKAPHRAIMMGGFAGTGHVLGKHNIDQ